MITALLCSALIGAMILFNAAVTPVVFTRLDAANQSIFLRAAFPRLFIFGLIVSLLVVVAAGLEQEMIAAAIAVAVAIGFALNAFIVTPAINRARDDARSHPRKFQLLHGASISIFVAKLVALGVVIAITAGD